MRKPTWLHAAAVTALALPLAGLAAQTPPPPAAAPAASEDARLYEFLDKEFAEDLKTRPQTQTQLGMAEGKDRWDDTTDAAAKARVDWRRASVARMKAGFDRAKLSPEGQANYDIWALEADRAALAYQYRLQTPPFYSFLYSTHQQLPNFLIGSHTVQNAADARAYIARLRGIPAVLDEAVRQSSAAAAAGVRAPKFQIERIVTGSRAIVTGAPFDAGAPSPLWADIETKVGKLRSGGTVSEAEAATLLADARTALAGIKPAYDRVIAWAQAELPTAPSGRVGAITLPDGAAWYAAALKLNTTTDLTADQIHAIGLKEVARIEGEQDALARQAGMKDRHAFYADLAKRFPVVPWTDALRAKYLKEANEAIAFTRTLLPKYFGKLPVHRMEVIREPSFSEVAGGAAHAGGPSPDGVRPGRVYVHLLGTTDSTPPTAMRDLMCHEGVPGHVMQGDIQVQSKGGPKFRQTARYVAFGEGWALYAEALCKEMGAYPQISDDFMRYDAELFRAARLVVDTGIHAKGWTEDQAIDYIVKSGRASPDQGRSEVRRYITLPGQATGYKIGMLKIVELRAKAEKALGPKFDIRGFHDLLIGSGSLPLPILERQVDTWIASRR